ncbi:HTH-type transcriptional regulator ycgE [Klebsiella pneumoniae]|uniref:HTH-type transcriptional regulator ycgE n=1 Tax=Klebsiella pneumoniae TaxID=573 RepID=A0A3S4GLQ4_KLEPN|nr:HTH-type transcriptional regulator ycgE [Klebsiella pneumoniae]
MRNQSGHTARLAASLRSTETQRSEGGHRQFDEEDILRIEEIKRWIERGVSVGKVKALLEDNLPAARDESAHLQEEMMSILRYMQPPESAPN